jgi:hypothetical protein
MHSKSATSVLEEEEEEEEDTIVPSKFAVRKKEDSNKQTIKGGGPVDRPKKVLSPLTWQHYKSSEV